MTFCRIFCNRCESNFDRNLIIRAGKLAFGRRLTMSLDVYIPQFDDIGDFIWLIDSRSRRYWIHSCKMGVSSVQCSACLAFMSCVNVFAKRTSTCQGLFSLRMYNGRKFINKYILNVLLDKNRTKEYDIFMTIDLIHDRTKEKANDYNNYLHSKWKFSERIFKTRY